MPSSPTHTPGTMNLLLEPGFGDQPALDRHEAAHCVFTQTYR